MREGREFSWTLFEKRVHTPKNFPEKESFEFDKIYQSLLSNSVW